MVTLWLHTASLLALLATSCPGSQATTTTQQLCGPHLVDALHLVCGDRGFLYMPRTDGSAVLRLQRAMAATAASAGGSEVAEFPTNGHTAMMEERSIVERCCIRPCSLNDLERYCF